MKEEQEPQEENAEQHGDRSANFLGEIPEAWKRRARAAFGYAFCVVMLIVIPCEIATRMFPAVTWLAAISGMFRGIGHHLYHYGVGLSFGIVAPCLAWENIMYLREKRRREKAEALAAAVNAELQREREKVLREREEAQREREEAQREREEAQRERAEAQRARAQAEVINAQLQEQIHALETEVTQLRRELNGSNARSSE